MDFGFETEDDVGAQPETGSDQSVQTGLSIGASIHCVQKGTTDAIFINAVIWTGGIKWAVQLLSWTSMFVLARLLSPADYGIVGMTGVFTLLISYISEFGLGTTVVTAQTLSTAQLAQINTVAVMLGTAAMLVSWATAKPISWFFHMPAISTLVVVFSITMISESVRTVPYAWLAKNMEFRFLALMEGSRSIAYLGVTLTFAFLGYGYWSLAAGNIAASLLMAVLLVRKARIPYERPAWNCLRDLLRVGQNIMIGNLAWYGYSNADFLMAGRLLGPDALGAYSNAWTMATAPLEKIASVVNRITPSLFSSLRDENAEFRRYLLRITELLALLMFPAVCGLALVATDFVQLAFGAKWKEMIAPLRLLAIYTGLNSLSTLFSPVMISKGHSRFSRNISLVAFFILPIGFYIGGKLYGSVGIAAVWVTLYPMVLLFAYAKIFRIIELSPREYFASIVPALSGTAFMIVVISGLKFFLPTHMALPVRLAILVGFGFATYAGSVFLLHRATAIRLLQVIRIKSSRRDAV